MLKIRVLKTFDVFMPPAVTRRRHQVAVLDRAEAAGLQGHVTISAGSKGQIWAVNYENKPVCMSEPRKREKSENKSP